MKFISVVLALIALSACTTVGRVGDDFTTPSEVLLPTLGQAIYVGDDLVCTEDKEGIYRYGTDMTLSLCSDGGWSPIVIEQGKVQ